MSWAMHLPKFWGNPVNVIAGDPEIVTDVDIKVGGLERGDGRSVMLDVAGAVVVFLLGFTLHAVTLSSSSSLILFQPPRHSLG
jgi:hypothetical protein